MLQYIVYVIYVKEVYLIITSVPSSSLLFCRSVHVFLNLVVYIKSMLLDQIQSALPRYQLKPIIDKTQIYIYITFIYILYKLINGVFQSVTMSIVTTVQYTEQANVTTANATRDTPLTAPVELVTVMIFVVVYSC